MKSDIEIARETDLRKIKEVATTLGIPREEVQKLWQVYCQGSYPFDR